MLHGAVVLSRHPRAVVLEIDTSAVLGMPGVERVLAADEVPGTRLVGLIRQDWPVFVAPGETTRCVGDVLALVLADTRFGAKRAAEALEKRVLLISSRRTQDDLDRQTDEKTHKLRYALQKVQGTFNATVEQLEQVLTLYDELFEAAEERGVALDVPWSELTEEERASLDELEQEKAVLAKQQQRLIWLHPWLAWIKKYCW